MVLEYLNGFSMFTLLSVLISTVKHELILECLECWLDQGTDDFRYVSRCLGQSRRQKLSIPL